MEEHIPQEEIPAPNYVVSLKSKKGRYSNEKSHFPKRKLKRRREVPKPKIPPIIIRESDDWMSLSEKLSTKRIGFTKASTIKDGIKVFPSTSMDYRNLIGFPNTSD
ncbi:hypothetical protein WA026_012648 [Henosepilachna vigintioctopunctata]|uniref:Uncharacterized protein n=1 Tax=Henosepilachna vigintioctopunctata TaxID=420089 RepID=A0AAW1U6P7_9CUCU